MNKIGEIRVSTVTCAPVYSEILGLCSEVVLGPEVGLPRNCAARCDFLMLMFKDKLTGFVGSLPPEKVRELDRALVCALDIQSTV